MHEDVLAGLRGDEAVALLGVEPFHGSNRHVLVPPPPSWRYRPTPADAGAGGKGTSSTCGLSNLHLCQAHPNGYGHFLSQPGVRAMPPSTTMAVPASCLRGSQCGRWRAKLQASNDRLVNVYACHRPGATLHRDASQDSQPM